MKKFLISAVIFSAFIMSLCGCGKNLILTESADNTQQPERNRSIFIYMSGGDSEAEYGISSKTLRDIAAADYGENINVIIQTGGCVLWHENGISQEGIDRFEVRNGALHKLTTLADTNMGESASLMDFLKWGNENYPAKSRILIICGQGGGCVGGIAHDARHNYDSLTPGEVAYALSRTGVSYDLVGFDACMMSTLETASAIAPYANFMTASEEYQPCSWDYSKWLKFASDNPTAPADDIGRKICDTYYNKCVDHGQEDTAAIAVTDLSKISALAQAFDGLAGNLTAVSDSFDSYRDFAFNIKNVHFLGGKNAEEGYSNLLDLDDFASKTSDTAGYNYALINDALTDAVVYKLNGMLENYVCGIGIFYPVRQNADELKKYFDIVQSSNYTDFLSSICTKAELNGTNTDYRSSWAWSDYINERGYFQYSSKIENNCYELDINGNMDIVRNVSLNLYRRDTNGMYLYIGSDCGMDIDRSAGIYKDNGDNSCFKINGHIVTAYLIDTDENYLLYSIPVYLNGVPGSIRAALINKNGRQKFKIYGFWKGIKVAYGISDRHMSKIKPTDSIEPFSHEYAGGEYYKSKSFLAGFMLIGRKAVPDGEYKLEYTIEDIYGDIIRTDPSDMTVSGGNTEKH